MQQLHKPQKPARIKGNKLLLSLHDRGGVWVRRSRYRKSLQSVKPICTTHGKTYASFPCSNQLTPSTAAGADVVVLKLSCSQVAQLPSDTRRGETTAAPPRGRTSAAGAQCGVLWCKTRSASLPQLCNYRQQPSLMFFKKKKVQQFEQETRCPAPLAASLQRAFATEREALG